ncbi:hypothetical protein AQUCO_00200031v1 [Aquilegia coerulea]|uniref:Fe2OG dioxygenase domain-containing protein n=1 Tax=Aquilegia coerulea TaxID=218851 RepID=A0A2G5F1B5_AQUCA|nr:hypothetical protein AQUCO_00200031v1 [Aquilegia coerulea]
MAEKLNLPIIDLSSSDQASTAQTIREACVHYGFFYLVNHGVEDELINKVFDESKKFFSLPMHEKMKLTRKENRGYSPLFAEKLDTSAKFMEFLPSWRPTMTSYYDKVISAGKKLLTLIALALNLDETFFEKIGASHNPHAFLRLLHYPGEPASLHEETYGASAHSDYGMITLLATDGVRGLQISREKDTKPPVWEDVYHVNGAFIVNIGDLMERWTNCLFRSTLHRVMSTEQERYSVAFFFEPNEDCIVKCLDSCCSEISPPRFPPVRSGDYLEERFRVTFLKA